MREPQRISPAREKFRYVAFRTAYIWKLGSAPRDLILETVWSREIFAARAMWGFGILGTNASPAIPELVELARKGEPWRSPAAVAALGYLGKEALPPLLALAEDPHFPFRKEAMASLGEMHDIGTAARPAVVWLIESLEDPELGYGAADILGRLHLESEISVPALAGQLQSTNQVMRRFAVIGLGKFGEQAQSALPQLNKSLNDPDSDVRERATNALRAIANGVAR
jgi:HEAT repeat protein